MTTLHNKLRDSCLLVLLALTATGFARADDTNYDLTGHWKTRLLADKYPQDSLFNELIGATAFDVESDVRLNLSADRDDWSFDAAWQLYAGY